MQIAQTQCKLEDDLAREANRVLICDTNPLATGIWHERYMNSRSAEVEELAGSRRYQLYVLTDCDIPFVQDGLRDGENVREWMTSRFEQRLSEQETPWIKVSGTRRERIETCLKKIDDLLHTSSI